MRVVHVITRLIIGGAQENTIASVMGLRDKPDLEVHLIAGPTEGPEGTLEPEARNVPGLFTLLPELVRPVYPLKDLSAFLRLTRHFRKTQPHLVHTHSGKAGILGRLAAKRAGVPLIIHTIHGPSFGAFQGAAANFIFRAAERFAARHTTHFISVADAMTRQYLAAGIGTPERYTRIFSGFNLEPFLRAQNEEVTRAKLGLGPEDFVLGKIARLFRLKGHDDLFEIAPSLIRAIPRLKILLVGDGEWRERFETMAKRPPLKGHFIFAGLAPPKEVPRHIGVMDALAHLSYREGLPRTLPQAQAAGKPVIAYDCDGVGEACLDGRTGLLVKPRDLAGLTEAIIRVARDESLRDRFGRAGRQFAKEHFGLETLIDSQYRLYQKLAKHVGISP